ncbi:hypothetical protein [Streptacidiphilus sp. EB129]|uniref:hypothetical protein n=1 Tax=Streptacidiphilus sp. EB129 TaxID=3156262 RepID=UPI00351451AF
MDSDLTDPAAPATAGLGSGSVGGGGGHEISVSERGAFSTARCSCGWIAPARRSRDKARRDAAEHLG